MKLLLFLTLLTSIAGQYTLQAMDHQTMAAMHHAHMRDNVDNRENPHSGCCCCCMCTLYVLASVHDNLKNHSYQPETVTQVSENSCPTTPFNSFITPPPAYSSHPYSFDKFAQSQFSTDLCAADESDENMPDKKDK